MVTNTASLTATPVFDWDDSDDPEKIVHLVANKTEALSARNAAFCGAQPGELGWVIWHGHVPEPRRCLDRYPMRDR